MRLNTFFFFFFFWLGLGTVLKLVFILCETMVGFDRGYTSRSGYTGASGRLRRDDLGYLDTIWMDQPKNAWNACAFSLGNFILGHIIPLFFPIFFWEGAFFFFFHSKGSLSDVLLSPSFAIFHFTLSSSYFIPLSFAVLVC